MVGTVSPRRWPACQAVSICDRSGVGPVPSAEPRSYVRFQARNVRGVAKPGIARALGARDRGFESRRPDHRHRHRHASTIDQRSTPEEWDKVSETASALRATSDALLADLEALEELERKKRELEPDDPQLVDAARKVETIARRLLGQSVRQRELTAVVTDLVQAGHPEAPQHSIEATPREIHQILAEWRDAERRSQDAAPGSAQAEAVADD